jgi:hypothetical protein
VESVTDQPDDKVMVTLPITETEAERKARTKAGLPLPHYSYMVSGRRKEPEPDGGECA